MLQRIQTILATGALLGICTSATADAFFMPPDILPITEVWTFSGPLKTMFADVSRLNNIEFSECATEQPMMMEFLVTATGLLGGAELRSDACPDSPLQSLPDGVQEMRVEVGCQEGGGGYTHYATFDGTTHDDDGALIPTSQTPEAYADCLDETWSPAFRVIFEYG